MQRRSLSARPRLRAAILLLGMAWFGAPFLWAASSTESEILDAADGDIDTAADDATRSDTTADDATRLDATATDPSAGAPASVDPVPADAALTDESTPDESTPDESTPDESTAAAATSEPAPESAPAAAGPAGPETLAESLGSVTSDLDLVETQIDAREYDTARTWLESHISELERGTHGYDPILIRPLTLLGDASMGTGEYAQALQHYQRATHLARVSAGLQSLEQLETVYREAAAYKALGAYKEASSREEYAYDVLARRSGPNDPSLLPALYRLADWYMDTGNYFAARELYQRAISIHDTNGQMETEAAIPALQGLARTYQYERFAPTHSSLDGATASMVAGPDLEQPVTLNNFPAGEQALQQVVRILQQTPDADPMKRLEAVLDLADWYALFDKTVRSEPLYAHAFELMGNIPDADRVSYFGEPKLLYFPEPAALRAEGAGRGTETLTGFVELGYDVSALGYVRNLQTINSQPEGLMDLRVRRSMRAARYRPALVDGVPVTSANRTYRYEFVYEAEPEPAPDDDEKPSGERGKQARDTTDKSQSEVARQ